MARKSGHEPQTLNIQNCFFLSWDRNAKLVLRMTPKHSIEHINPLNSELNLICYLLALLGAHHFLHVSRIRVKLLTLR